MPKPTLSKTSSQHGQILVRDNAGQHHCSCPGVSREPCSSLNSTLSMSEHRAIPSGRASSSHSAGASSGRNRLRNTTHSLDPSVTASVQAKSSAVVSSTSTDARDRNTSARRMTTQTVLPVPPSSGTSPPNSTVFTGAGAQNLGMSAVVGGAILLSFLWFLWQWGSGGSW
ncbi:hypothetical protein BDV18DRAFT_152452 [Aspergillus unguis]